MPTLDTNVSLGSSVSPNKIAKFSTKTTFGKEVSVPPVEVIYQRSIFDVVSTILRYEMIQNLVYQFLGRFLPLDTDSNSVADFESTKLLPLKCNEKRLEGKSFLLDNTIVFDIDDSNKFYIITGHGKENIHKLRDCPPEIKVSNPIPVQFEGNNFKLADLHDRSGKIRESVKNYLVTKRNSSSNVTSNRLRGLVSHGAAISMEVVAAKRSRVTGEVIGRTDDSRQVIVRNKPINKFRLPFARISVNLDPNVASFNGYDVLTNKPETEASSINNLAPRKLISNESSFSSVITTKPSVTGNIVIPFDLRMVSILPVVLLTRYVISRGCEDASQTRGLTFKERLCYWFNPRNWV